MAPKGLYVLKSAVPLKGQHVENSAVPLKGLSVLITDASEGTMCCGDSGLITVHHNCVRTGSRVVGLKFLGLTSQTGSLD